MLERHDYPVTVRWTAGKQGIAGSPDDLPELVVTAPPEFGGPPHLWSPEHLFVSAVASCFMTTFMAIARNSKVEIGSLEVPAFGSLVLGDDRRYSMTRVRLEPRITLVAEKDRAKVERLVDKADKACLISRSVKSEIVVEPTLTVAPEREPVAVG